MHMLAGGLEDGHEWSYGESFPPTSVHTQIQTVIERSLFIFFIIFHPQIPVRPSEYTYLVSWALEQFSRFATVMAMYNV